MKYETLIYIGGIFHITWAVFDLSWPKLFKWDKNLACLDDLHRFLLPITSKLMATMFLALAYISLFHTTALMTTALGGAILIFIIIFWTLRAILQAYYYGFEKANSFNLTFSEMVPFFPFNRMSNKATSYYFFIHFIVMIGLYLIPYLNRHC